ncbi:MAG TPA: DNA/RNA non-specific endonuclease [Bacteroidales bacterium]|nr:DNA/RNA non-specific endonuclease [Bacteroidales bacterium]
MVWTAFIYFLILFASGGEQVKHYEMPETSSVDTVICHTHYCLQYSEPHEQARWVAYEFTINELPLTAERATSFRTDPLISTISADNDDYAGSGYDKGHLAPSRDMAFDPIAQQESFYLSNVSPQLPGFNRGIWRGLEFKVRKWVEQYERVFVITGPVLRDGLPYIGENKVSVPEFYFKAVLVCNDTICKTAGFIIPNAEGLGNTYSKYAVSVDSLENLLQLNLFYLLDDDLENISESELDYGFWQLIKPE